MPESKELTTADVVLLIHALKAYALEAKRDHRLAKDMSRLAVKVQALYPEYETAGEQKGAAQ